MFIFVVFNLAFIKIGRAVDYSEMYKKVDREKLISQLADELMRIDPDLTRIRKVKKKSWAQIANDALKSSNGSLMDFGRSIVLLDLGYPNLHSRLSLAPEIDYLNKVKDYRLPLSIETRVAKEDGSRTTFLVHSILKQDKSWKTQPKKNDKLIMINGVSIDELRRKNAEFCKYQQLIQCDTSLIRSLEKGILTGNILNNPKVSMTFERGSSSYTIDVVMSVLSQTKVKRTDCEDYNDIYPGYKLLFSKVGVLCLYAHRNKPIAVLKLSSFAPQEINESYVGPPEVADSFLEIWKSESSKFKKLIIDISNNSGGDSPVPIVASIIDQPFHDLWYQLANSSEASDSRFRTTLYNGKISEVLYDRLGVFDSKDNIKPERFFPAIPQFCKDPGRCLKHKHPPKMHNFSGQIRIVTNHRCGSSCSAFIWMVKTFAKKGRVKVIGFPDSGDTSYGRLRLNVWFQRNSPGKFMIRVVPERYRAPMNSLLLMSLLVTNTLSTDGRGNNVSMTPAALDLFVPWTSDYDDWIVRSLRKAEGI